MYKLQPAYKDYVWGGNKLKKMYDMKNGDRLAESWALSVHPDGSSMYLASFADYVKNNPKSVDKHSCYDQVALYLYGDGFVAFGYIQEIVKVFSAMLAQERCHALYDIVVV